MTQQWRSHLWTRENWINLSGLLQPSCTILGKTPRVPLALRNVTRLNTLWTQKYCSTAVVGTKKVHEFLALQKEAWKAVSSLTLHMHNISQQEHIYTSSFCQFGEWIKWNLCAGWQYPCGKLMRNRYFALNSCSTLLCNSFPV